MVLVDHWNWDLDDKHELDVAISAVSALALALFLDQRGGLTIVRNMVVAM